MSECVWNIGEMVLTGDETKYLENNLSVCHSVHQKSRKNWTWIEPGVSLWIGN